MASTAVAAKSEITLRGSTEIVTEFFAFGVNNILFQRGIYPPESFVPVSKYGTTMMVTSDEGLKHYLQQIMTQLADWLVKGEVQKLVLVVTGVETKEVRERWVFNVEMDTSVTADGPGKEKSPKEIQSEIQAVVRQITATVTFLPLLDEPCTFDLLVYTKADADVPTSWEESDPKYITNAEDVRLRSFSTAVHKVDTMVTYKADDV